MLSVAFGIKPKYKVTNLDYIRINVIEDGTFTHKHVTTLAREAAHWHVSK